METKIDIISGFLGAGKTTLIKKFLTETLTGQKVALIENEFGTVGIDGNILKDFGIVMKELNAGCICCSIAGDFTLGLKEVLLKYKPDRIIIEPSGVSKLSDVIKGCKPFLKDNMAELNLCITVLDVTKFSMYLKNFAEFYKDQILYAKTIILSRSNKIPKDKIDSYLRSIREINQEASIITTDWELLTGEQIMKTGEDSIAELLEDYLSPSVKGSNLKRKRNMADISRIKNVRSIKKIPEHNAEDNFMVWGVETSKTYDKEKLQRILENLKEQDGLIIRGKGILETNNKEWMQFDYVPGEITIRKHNTECIGKLCIIGSGINIEKIAELFEINP